jgi:hypothetical protein
MMTAKEYRDTAEYGIMRRWLVEELVRVTNECINSPTMEVKEYNRGYCDALKTVLSAPDDVLPQSAEPEQKLLEEEDSTTLGAILIANRPNEGVW